MEQAEADTKLFTRNQKNTYDRKQKVLLLLKEATKPLNITEISKVTGADWMATKLILIDLELEGLVKHFRSGKVILFRIKTDFTDKTLKDIIEAKSNA